MRESVRRTIAVIVICIVEPVSRSKEEAGEDKNGCESQQNQFDIHMTLSKITMYNGGCPVRSWKISTYTGYAIGT